MATENELDCAEQSCKILELPHYVLRILLSYLDSTSLYQLSETCSYLKEAVEDPALWKHIDARSEPNSSAKIHYVTERIHERTANLLLRGYKKYSSVPQNFFEKINLYEHIKVLALESVKLYGSKVSLKDFPGCLEELSLKRSYVKSSVYFFQHSAKRMQNLRVLILDECSWVTCSFLLSVSKFENLEIISAVKCLRAHMNMVPYLNVAKYGCKKLKILDFRFTGIGGELLRTFCSKHPIQRMYFQSYKSAEVDYQENMNSSPKMLSRSSVNVNADLNITDNSLRDYTHTTPDTNVEPITKSMLYQDPYPDCQCGYKNSNEDRIMPETVTYSLEDDYDVYGPPTHTTAKFVCKKHMKDVEKLPDDFKDFFVIHQQQFHSDITSDIDDSDSDSSDGSDDPGCCIYAMGTKMVILPNVHEPNSRSEMDLPGRDGFSRNFVPFNIFVVNPFDPRNNRQQQDADERPADDNPQPGPSRAADENYDCCAADSKKRKHDDSDSDTDDEPTPPKRRDLKDGLETGEHIRKNGGFNDDYTRYWIDSEKSKKTNDSKIDGTGQNDECNQYESDSDTEERHKRKGRRFSGSDDEDCGKKRFRLGASQNDRDNGIGEPQETERDSVRVKQVEDHQYPPIEQRFRYDGWPSPKISLRRISLRGYKKVTHFALLYLRYLQIELIDLTYTSVTKREIENFLLYNPNCRVIHPMYCVCKPKNPFS
ncbi:unnamed protein product [Acanthoscelides obtectus]|uniref:F-box domain-containing protein n=1 Tax=Acanthoscelides obtectus TaxID=200917 RepID=A0A9P0PAD8_ACAOB|nr:unnamed protein product [Acanthoscelides obtectus]CAK1665203.1 hypothetical protein AOBTE_LOCUS24709 [Acanthoscelides obtectus]